MNLENMVSNVFFGSNTYGTNVQVAVKDGKWYFRTYGYNGYGNGWKKWEALNETPEVYKNAFNQECIKWGWNELVGGVNNRLRVK